MKLSFHFKKYHLMFDRVQGFLTIHHHHYHESYYPRMQTQVMASSI